MKKYLIIGGLLLALLVATAGMASANGGPHGGYSATTDACAGCHRAHTATGPKLLIAADTYSLCMTCHGAAATGADTNVEDGVYLDRDGTTENPAEGTVNAGLNGGKFGSTTNASTSAHDVSSTITAVWGYDALNPARGIANTMASLDTGLDCASCHDPHGTDGYRLLRAGPTLATDDYDSGAKSYTSETWNNTKISDFCASCHVAYHETAANVGSDTAAQSFSGGYTHRVDMTWNDPGTTGATFGANDPETQGYDGTGGTGDEIPLAGTAAVCTTCHFAHGTDAAMSGNSLNAGPSGNTGSSALLRLDERGVCQSCHQKQ